MIVHVISMLTTCLGEKLNRTDNCSFCYGLDKMKTIALVMVVVLGVCSSFGFDITNKSDMDTI